jgi:GntR family carbon starvation induced transcriptional regulator
MKSPALMDPFPELSLSGGERSVTLASIAYTRLKREIITARLLPDERLHIAHLCERYGIGSSPMREALTRLARDGLAIQTDQKGFRVAPIGIAQLDELVRTRCWLNEIGLRESMRQGDEQWEERVVLASHRLRRDTAPQEGTERPSGWEDAHRIFHDTLISACRSERLRTVCEELFDASERYRYLSRVRARGAVPREEHQRIAEAAIARDEPLAIRLLTEHFEGTAAAVRERLAADEGPS